MLAVAAAGGAGMEGGPPPPSPPLPCQRVLACPRARALSLHPAEAARAAPAAPQVSIPAASPGRHGGHHAAARRPPGALGLRGPVAGAGPGGRSGHGRLAGGLPRRRGLGGRPAPQRAPALHGGGHGLPAGRRAAGVPRVPHGGEALGQGAARAAARRRAARGRRGRGGRDGGARRAGHRTRLQPARLVRPGRHGALRAAVAPGLRALRVPRRGLGAARPLPAPARVWRRGLAGALRGHGPAGHHRDAALQHQGHLQQVCARGRPGQRAGAAAGGLRAGRGLHRDARRVEAPATARGAGALHGLQDPHGGRQPRRQPVRRPEDPPRGARPRRRGSAGLGDGRTRSCPSV